jgi:hypothetical protein
VVIQVLQDLKDSQETQHLVVPKEKQVNQVRQSIACMISGFHHGVDKIFALLCVTQH